MNLDTVLTFFSSYKHCAKILFSKELIRKVICVGKCEEFFQAGSTCTFFYKLHTQYGKKSMCWLNIFISSLYPQGQDNRRIKTHIFLRSGFKILSANLLNVHVYKYMYSFFPKHSWLTFTLDQVKVELLQRPHGNLSDIIIHQEVHQGSCHMFTRRHARSFSNLLL